MRNRNITLLLAILLVALILRLAYLGTKSIWLDEAFAVWQADKSPAEIWNAEYDNHPPMYYLLLQTWMAFGRGEAVIRLPSVLTSMISLVLLYILARRLCDEKTALAAVALLAVAPLDLWYAQEARMVIFVIPAALLIALGLSRLGWRGAVLITAGLSIGLYFDYTIIPLWTMLSSIWFVLWWQEGRSPRQLLTWMAASLIGWIMFMPLWPHLNLVASRMSDIFVFANIRDITGIPSFGVALPVIALAFLAIGTIILTRWIPVILARPGLGEIAAALAIALFVLLTVLEPIPRLYSVKRLVVTGWPFVVLGIAWLSLNKFRKPKQVAAGLVIVSFIATLVTLLAVPKDDWRSAVAYINQNAGPDDAVWMEPSYGILPYGYYQPTIPSSYLSEDVIGRPQSAVWHIAERQPNRPIPGSSAETWLDSNRKLLEVVPLYRLEIRHYSSAE